MDHPVIVENISSHGARLRTSRPWPLREVLDLDDAAVGLNVRAEVVYCLPVSDTMYAIGVKFEHRVDFDIDIGHAQ